MKISPRCPCVFFKAVLFYLLHWICNPPAIDFCVVMTEVLSLFFVSVWHPGDPEPCQGSVAHTCGSVRPQGTAAEPHSLFGSRGGLRGLGQGLVNSHPICPGRAGCRVRGQRGGCKEGAGGERAPCEDQLCLPCSPALSQSWTSEGACCRARTPHRSYSTSRVRQHGGGLRSRFGTWANWRPWSGGLWSRWRRPWH